MNREHIENALASPSEQTIATLLADETTVFYVDWREEDDAIAGCCEDVLQTGTLSGEMVEADNVGGYEVRLHYAGKSVVVPLTYSLADRHITLHTLNTLLKPDYEIRACADSFGSDTLAFLPLPVREWAELERRYGNAVARRFCPISERPNLFTDSLPRASGLSA